MDKQIINQLLQEAVRLMNYDDYNEIIDVVMNYPTGELYIRDLAFLFWGIQNGDVVTRDIWDYYDDLNNLADREYNLMQMSGIDTMYRFILLLLKLLKNIVIANKENLKKRHYPPPPPPPPSNAQIIQI